MVDFTTEQVLPISFKVVDGRGRTVKLDGDPVAASSDETIVTVGALTNDGSNVWKGEINSVSPGDARVTVSGDGDIGDGVQTVTGVLEVTVTLDPRTGERITDLESGTPTDKPA
jgi:hypothetical protein